MNEIQIPSIPSRKGQITERQRELAHGGGGVSCPLSVQEDTSKDLMNPVSWAEPVSIRGQGGKARGKGGLWEKE